jgi:hypothetical protein
MTLPQAWMQQAESDYRAARRVDNNADPRTRCQAISKYQQCVEKSVKGVLDRLNTAGITNAHSDSRHHVARYAAVFINVPRTARQASGLLNQLASLFTNTIVEQIVLLDSLVPEYPAAGALAGRNHEYPFQVTAADWRAPSDEDAFTAGEMRRIRSCAGTLIRGLRRIFDALELLFP